MKCIHDEKNRVSGMGRISLEDYERLNNDGDRSRLNSEIASILARLCQGARRASALCPSIHARPNELPTQDTFTGKYKTVYNFRMVKINSQPLVIHKPSV